MNICLSRVLEKPLKCTVFKTLLKLSVKYKSVFSLHVQSIMLLVAIGDFDARTQGFVNKTY